MEDNKESFINRIKKIILNNYKLIILIISIILGIFIFYQIYILKKNKDILETSIIYDDAQYAASDLEFNDLMNLLSEKDNFYGTLALLENIKFKIENNDLKSAYVDYIKILNKKDLSENYKSIVAIQASYFFIDKLNSREDISSPINLDTKEIKEKINTFLSYIDSSLESYNGFGLEIRYLLSVIDDEDKGIVNNSDNTNSLYKEIIDNEKISSSLKERVNKIHEYQKYK